MNTTMMLLMMSGGSSGPPPPDSTGYIRPDSPSVGYRFEDLYLDETIEWDGAEWIDGEGAPAGAPFTPDLAAGGTLLAAWHLESGVTLAGSQVTAVTAKFGTSVDLLTQVGASNVETLSNGRIAFRGTTLSSLMQATMGANIDQPLTYYSLGEWNAQLGNIISSGSNRPNVRIDSGLAPALQSSTLLSTGNSSAAHDGELFIRRDRVNGATSHIRVEFEDDTIDQITGDAGVLGGDTRLRVGAFSSGSADNAQCATAMILYYSGVSVDETHLLPYLREWMSFQ